jgi:hypothetical protein
MQALSEVRFYWFVAGLWSMGGVRKLIREHLGAITTLFCRCLSFSEYLLDSRWLW